MGKKPRYLRDHYFPDVLTEHLQEIDINYCITITVVYAEPVSYNKIFKNIQLGQ